MSEFVLDCSVALAWCFQDEADDRSVRVLGLLRQSEALVPTIWSLELANALLVAERRKCITQADAVQFLSLVRELPIRTDSDTSDAAVDRIISLARSYDLASYDACYLELAVRAGLPIATLDAKLASAAESVGIALVSA